jgi:fructoselysine 6-kinase
MARLIGVGDNTVDTYLHMRMRFPGGNTVNVPVLAHRYGCQAAYLGWVGEDDGGRLIMDSLAKEGIDISHCRMVKGTPTAYSTVTLVDGDRVFGESDSGASKLIELKEDDFNFIRSFDLVHTSVFSHLENQIAALKQASRCLSFDFSQKLDSDYLERIVPYVDIALLSLADVSPTRMETLMNRVHELGASLVVMTRGKEGAWVFDGEKLGHQEIIPVDAVDTLGAGDAFAARFLVEYLDDTPIPVAMEHAAHSAAECCTYYGAFGYGVSF